MYAMCPQVLSIRVATECAGPKTRPSLTPGAQMCGPRKIPCSCGAYCLSLFVLKSLWLRCRTIPSDFFSTDSTVIPPKLSVFLQRTFHCFSAQGNILLEKGTHTISCVQTSNDRRPRGVDGHRISGDPTESWFGNRRFRKRNVGGATV